MVKKNEKKLFMLIIINMTKFRDNKLPVIHEEKYLFDYNSLNRSELNSQFYDWYELNFKSNPICLYINLLGYENLNDFITFDFSKTHNLNKLYDIYKDYFIERDFYLCVKIMKFYLEYFVNKYY